MGPRTEIISWMCICKLKKLCCTNNFLVKIKNKLSQKRTTFDAVL